jgi:hypothetical protein
MVTNEVVRVWEEQSWPNWSTLSSFAWRAWRKPWQSVIRIVSGLVEIRIRLHEMRTRRHRTRGHYWLCNHWNAEWLYKLLVTFLVTLFCSTSNSSPLLSLRLSYNPARINKIKIFNLLIEQLIKYLVIKITSCHEKYQLFPRPNSGMLSHWTTEDIDRKHSKFDRNSTISEWSKLVLSQDNWSGRISALDLLIVILFDWRFYAMTH